MNKPDRFLDQFISLYIFLFIHIFINVGHMIRGLLGHKKSGQRLSPVINLIKLINHSLLTELDLVLVGHGALVEESHSHSGKLDISNTENMMDC